MAADVHPALEAAARVARRWGHATVREQHLLLGALEPPSSEVTAALRAAGVELAELRAALEASCADMPNEPGDVTPLVPPELAAALAGESEPALSSRQLAAFLGLRELARALRREAIDVDLLRRLLDEAPSAPAAETPALGRYALDVTERALRGELDPVTGRDQEIEQLVLILPRRTKSNALIIGEPGVGKTALIEGLAQRIVARQVPDALARHAIFALDLGKVRRNGEHSGAPQDRRGRLVSQMRLHEGCDRRKSRRRPSLPPTPR